jgi:hypothetical protein
MKIVVMALAVTALLSGCVTRTYDRETVVEPQRPASSSTVVVPQGSTPPSGPTIVVPQSAPPPPSGDTTIIVPR